MAELAKRLGSFWYNSLTLKRRIIVLFMLSSLLPFLGIALISYYAIHSILAVKIQNGIWSNLNLIELSLENTISNLNSVSQQFAFESTVGKQLDQMLSAAKPFNRSQLIEELKSEFNSITFVNPNIGLCFYYFHNSDSYDFENFPVKINFSPDKLPVLAQYYGITYYGPHISNNRFDNQYVLSAMRKVGLPDRNDVYVYIEAGFHLTQGILDHDQVQQVSHLFLDNNERIAYSEAPQIFPTNAVFPGVAEGNASGAYNGYYWFKATSNQGWSVVSVIPQSAYNQEMNRWLVQIFLFGLLLLAFTLVLAWLLWKMVYRPLHKFNMEIRWMGQSGTSSGMLSKVNPGFAKTRIPEFDNLLSHFRQMKQQIWELFAEIERKEKKRADLEVEKLLYQINPHFLMNTLDTVHWLAIMNGQSEIDRLVLSLNKLLHYNLGKLGQGSTIREEIDALKQYLTLQQIRYDFQFDVQIDVDDRVLDEPVPRFILQPLVENALYHGLNDLGYIKVEVRLDSRIEISIEDNGSGMSEEAVHSLLHAQTVEHRKVGMGIGMNYVKRILETQYGEQASLDIKSEVGQGTTVTISLPFEGGRLRSGMDAPNS